MGKCLVILFWILLYLVSCSDNSNPIIQEHKPIAAEGRILNHNSEYSNVVAAVQIDSTLLEIVSSNIENDGSFVLEIPEPHPALFITHKHMNEVQEFNNAQILFTDSIEVKNNVNFVRYNFFVKNKDSTFDGNIFNSIQLDNIYLSDTSNYAQVGDYYVIYYYFEESTEVIGTQSMKYTNTWLESKIVTHYNVQIQKGWNILEVHLESDRNNLRIFRVTNKSEIVDNWIIKGMHNFNDWFQYL